MWVGLEAHLEDNTFDHIVHTVFLQETVVIFLESWVYNWRSFECNLIIWQGGVTERVLTVALLEY